jgi:hypothetical protein
MKKYTFLLAYLAAVILAQTLYFKFSGHAESVALFEALGVEPWGRIFTGVFELITAILLVVPATRIYGALLGVGLMCGAIASHLFVVGIESNGDRGFLFILAMVVFTACLILVYQARTKFEEIFARMRAVRK